MNRDMTDIELVIKIPEKDFEFIKQSEGARYSQSIIEAVINDTPLPKGHGRLIILSEDKVKENQINLDFSCQKWINEVGLSNATLAVIEADKGE